MVTSARVAVLRADADPIGSDAHRHGPAASPDAAPRRWSPMRIGLAGRLGIALCGIGLVWSAIALGLA